MDEWLPAVLGVLWGAVVGARARGPRATLPLLAPGALAVGALAAYVSGELARSPWFALVDGAIAALGAATGAVGIALLRAHASAHEHRSTIRESDQV